MITQAAIVDLKPHSNGLKTTNLVDVEVHHNGNGDLKNGHHDDLDEDEGEGKSLEIDDELEKSEAHQVESAKSNGTPTSGIVDDDDPFSDANDLNSPLLEPHKTEVKQIETDVKYVERHFEVQHSEPKPPPFETNNYKATRWSNLNEPSEITSESANNSAIDNSFNLTAADTDITVDSIKEHFSNLNIRNEVNFDVDLLLDTNDGKCAADELVVKVANALSFESIGDR